MFIKEAFFVLLFTKVVFIASGFVLSVKKFENNYLINENHGSSKIMLSHESYKKLNINEGDDFNFIENETQKSKTILQINELTNSVEVIVLNNENDKHKINEIKYFLENKNYWNNLLNL